MTIAWHGSADAAKNPAKRQTSEASAQRRAIYTGIIIGHFQIFFSRQWRKVQTLFKSY